MTRRGNLSLAAGRAAFPTPADAAAEAALVERARLGEEDAFTELVRLA